MQFNSHSEWEEWAKNTREIISRIDQAISQLESADCDCDQMAVSAAEAREWVDSLEPADPEEEDEEEEEKDDE